METKEAERSVTINLKAILILVIVVCLGLVVFVRTRRRYRMAAAAIPVITRGPLKPMTPPLTANKVGLLAELRARRFDALQSQLDAFQRRAEGDGAEEANAMLAIEAFGYDDPEIGSLLRQWVKKSPHSYSAHLAWAEYLFAQGWLARGGNWASETTKQQFAHMHALFARGTREARAALALNPRLSAAYVLLLERQQAEGRACLQLGAIALDRIPSSYYIRVQIMSCLEPRWGGTYEAMEQFAQASQAFVPENRRIGVLKGIPDFDRGYLMIRRGQYGMAVKVFTRAIEEDGDHAGFYRGRGEAFNGLHRYHDAIADLRRADRLWPQYPETLEALAFALATTGKEREALNELHIDNEVGGPSPYEEQLRTWIVMRLREGSKAKTARAGRALAQ